ncbi:MAG: lysophospholipase [Deltaproteobacteria bacterium]|nr:lysophospholipase [Deltaproteobacteria bacterium]
MKHNEFTWQTGDNLRIAARTWQPEDEPRAVICLVHGMGEHCMRYVHLAEYFTQKGYAVTTFDLRGHGQSEGQRGHSSSYQALMNDISHFLGEAKKSFPDLPRFLYGHSLGGNLVLNYTLRNNPELPGVIVTGPWLRLSFEPGKVQMALARIMRSAWPTFSQSSALDTKALARDPKVVQDYINDPLVHDKISARMFMDAFQAGRWALEHASEFNLPLLLMHGDADGLTSAEASRAFAENGPKNCTLKIWEGFYHELHNEPEKQEVFTFITEWLERLS